MERGEITVGPQLKRIFSLAQSKHPGSLSLASLIEAALDDAGVGLMLARLGLERAGFKRGEPPKRTTFWQRLRARRLNSALDAIRLTMHVAQQRHATTIDALELFETLMLLPGELGQQLKAR